MDERVERFGFSFVSSYKKRVLLGQMDGEDAFFLTVLHATSRGMEGQRRVDVVEGRWGMGPLILVYM